MPQAPYGAWRSPITAGLIVSATVRLGAPRLDRDDIYWLESRPQEGGRYVIVRRTPDGATSDVNPAPLNARTRVHEYGGGDYLVADGTVYFANFADQRIYVARPGAAPEALTHVDGMRYADFVLDARRGRLIAVREDHSGQTEAVNSLSALDIASGDETALVEGHDFFSSPRISPDGAMLCWTAWDHPNMPWDGCTLYVADLDAPGMTTNVRVVAGGAAESICQPAWSPDGRLYFISDRSGWWNLYRWSPASGAVEALAPSEAEFGGPHWQFGASYYAFETSDRLLCTYGAEGITHLATVDTATGALSDIETPFNVIGSLQLGRGRAVFAAASATESGGLYSLDLASGRIDLLKASSDVEIDPHYASVAQPIEFPTSNGQTAHAFYFPPANKDYEAPAGELPPLIVMSHGGPTAATSPAFSPRVQYWTTRGFAVLDVNYGGSTGYGRAYRERLNGNWGIVDVEDCVNGARYLVSQGLVDGERLAITGGSAGGYTTLAALAFHDTFKAGASHYGVADLEALARDTHKFESRYLDGLVGPYPGRIDLYTARSPIHHVEGLDCPVIFFQGLEDEIVPPNQAQTMVDALRVKGVPVAYLPFEGEQHGFRRAENIKRALEAELYFYGRIFGFTPADDIEPVEIANL
ncbi:MAG TPA: S9 family peptidase [Dehalococcoidia bacterium]|nr:S9 family peptidase [Dehalococcoidia bacterium]